MVSKEEKEIISLCRSLKTIWFGRPITTDEYAGIIMNRIFALLSEIDERQKN
jgi:hypothetical protein